MPPHARMKDVAALAGVSVPTVSQVLNGNGAALQLSQATIGRVEEAARELGYVRNTVARNLRAQRTHQIGVILSGFQDTSIPAHVRLSLEGAFLLGLTRAARERGLEGVMIYPTDPNRALEPSRFLDRRVDGLIVQSDPWGANLLRDLDPARLPVVGVWTQDARDGAGFVDVDQFGGAVQAVEHLIGLGHERIALVCPPPERATSSQSFGLRLAGYRYALEAAGIRPDVTWHVEDADGVIELLRGPNPITAAFAVTDRRAIALVRALEATDLRVPENLSVVGFDNVLGADTVAGGLTTVDHPVLEIGAAALENLLALIAGADAERCRTVVPTSLVVRHSTSAPTTASRKSAPVKGANQ